MDTKTATLLAAAAALTSSTGYAAPASEAPVPKASSYADLLQPIPNATERLRAADMIAATETEQPLLTKTQYHHHHNNYGNGYGYNRNHHHHHHHHNRWWYTQHGYYWYGGAWVLRPRHHHHHHHHHNNY
jgi:hypothetical protein